MPFEPCARGAKHVKQRLLVGAHECRIGPVDTAQDSPEPADGLQAREAEPPARGSIQFRGFRKPDPPIVRLFHWASP